LIKQNGINKDTLNKFSEVESSVLYKLPSNWRWARLKDIVENVQYGYTETSSLEQIGPKFLRITDIQNDSVNWEEVPYCKINENDLEKFKLENDDILIARTGATTGKSFLITDPPLAVFASYLIRIRCKENICPKYVWSFMKSSIYWNQITVMKKGSAQPGANAKILSNLVIPIPPLSEQKRISEKIQSLLNKIEKAHRLTEESKKSFESRRMAILDKAFRGGFDKDYMIQEYKDSKDLNYLIPSEWDWFTINDVCDLISDCPHSTPKYIEHGQYFAIRTSDVSFGKIDLSNARRVSESDFLNRTQRTKPIEGDIVYCREGSVGNAGMIEHENICLAQRVVLLRANRKKILPKYFALVLNSPVMRKQVFSNISQTTSPRINIGTLKQLKVPVPSLEEQQYIVKIIESILEYEENSREFYSVENVLKTLKSSILFKAFRGEL